jgi:hypothetical protein
VKSTHTGTDAEAEDTGQLSNAVVGHVQVAQSATRDSYKGLIKAIQSGGDVPKRVAYAARNRG